MSELTDAFWRLICRFGRPDALRLEEEHDYLVDTRLSTLEQRQAEIKARLRILEKQGNPRGIGRE